jgi:hypothetical protein
LEKSLDGRHQAADDLAADRFAQLRVRDGEIVAALEPIVDDPCGLAFHVEQKAGILTKTRGTIKTGAVSGTPAESSTAGRLSNTPRTVGACPPA